MLGQARAWAKDPRFLTGLAGGIGVGAPAQAFFSSGGE
jgi:hypothetical protein